MNQAHEEIDRAKVSHHATDLYPAVDRAVEILKGRAALRKEIYIITDGQASGWQQQEEIRKEHTSVGEAICDFQDILANKSRVLSIIREETKEIEERYGLHGPGPEVPPGHQFLATTTFQQKGLRERLLCDVATDNYKLASAEKGAQFAALAIQGTAAYLQDFIDHVPVEE